MRNRFSHAFFVVRLAAHHKKEPQALYEPAVLSFWAILFSQPLLLALICKLQEES